MNKDVELSVEDSFEFLQVMLGDTQKDLDSYEKGSKAAASRMRTYLRHIEQLCKDTRKKMLSSDEKKRVERNVKINDILK